MDAVKLLLENGADTNMPDHKGQTRCRASPNSMPRAGHDHAIARAWRETGCAKCPGRIDALASDQTRSRKSCCDLLLQHHPDQQLADKQGFTPLLYALDWRRKMDVVAQLLADKPDVKGMQDREGVRRSPVPWKLTPRRRSSPVCSRWARRSMARSKMPISSRPRRCTSRAGLWDGTDAVHSKPMTMDGAVPFRDSHPASPAAPADADPDPATATGARVTQMLLEHGADVNALGQLAENAAL